MALIESLESRVLFSVTPAQSTAALKAIATQEAIVVVDLNHLVNQRLADAAAINADLRRLRVTAADRSLVRAADIAATTLINALHKDESEAALGINLDARVLVGNERVLSHDPTSTIKLTRANADNNILTLNANLALTKFMTDSDTTTLDADLTAIASANSSDTQTSTDVTTEETDLANNLATATTDATTLFDTDVPALQALY